MSKCNHVPVGHDVYLRLADDFCAQLYSFTTRTRKRKTAAPPPTSPPELGRPSEQLSLSWPLRAGGARRREPTAMKSARTASQGVAASVPGAVACMQLCLDIILRSVYGDGRARPDTSANTVPSRAVTWTPSPAPLSRRMP